MRPEHPGACCPTCGQVVEEILAEPVPKFYGWLRLPPQSVMFAMMVRRPLEIRPLEILTCDVMDAADMQLPQHLLLSMMRSKVDALGGQSEKQLLVEMRRKEEKDAEGRNTKPTRDKASCGSDDEPLRGDNNSNGRDEGVGTDKSS